MAKDLMIPISNFDADVIRHIEPARLLDQCIKALEETGRTSDMRTLQGVRNAWVVLIGTARLQVMDGSRRPLPFSLGDAP